MTARKPPARRCAIYTRKSSEEGLNQDFNSLDAQREACAAYIRSQAGEGWQPVRALYDDGGFSGGTLDRPALKQLIADIEAGRINTVVVYKVDRLTRSLADFARIVEAFDAHDVSFVSVTQQFNTTTSMGRLTLNMLLSFAQFERDVTGERIRDKIAASKRKGMWMGGFVPLGYEPDGRTLTINEEEAETVRTVFRLYLEIGNVRLVKREADRLGLTTKVRNCDDGRMRGGRPLSRGYIYKLLGNPLYIGRIAHKGETYEGLHPAILDTPTWEAVQAKLASNTHDRASGRRKTDPSPLAGKLFDDAGGPMTPTHAIKAGRRYRYYVSRHLVSMPNDPHESGARVGWRLPAGEIERTVAESVRDLLTDPARLAALARDAGWPAESLPGLLKATGRWDGDAFELTERASLGLNQLTVTLNLTSLMSLASASCPPIRHRIPMRFKRRGVEMRLVIAGADGKDRNAKPDAALVKAIARAHRWFEDIATGRAASLGAIARVEGITDRYVGHLLPLAFLSPHIVEAILDGSQPVGLTAEALVKHTDLPLSWNAQKTLLGVA